MLLKNFREIGIFAGGAGGALLPNGIETSDWYGLDVRWNNGFGISSDGGGGDDNQEYLNLRRCILSANRLDALHIPRFKKIATVAASGSFAKTILF